MKDREPSILYYNLVICELKRNAETGYLILAMP